MKRALKTIFSMVLMLTMLMSLATTAFAASPSTITFKGAEEGFEFQPGSEYTTTDLFGNFKNVMPGDSLTENITLKNTATDCDYIKVYMRAIVHDENGNPLTYDKDYVASQGKQDETVATMQDFLSKLTMRIYNGTELIYEASPDEAGALVNNILLGTLRTGDSLNLKVELDVPIELDNKYANRVGEVDWVFLAECIEYNKLTVHKAWDDNGDPDRPDSVKVNLLQDGKVSETVGLNDGNQWSYSWNNLDDRYTWSVEEIVPDGYTATYKTQDNIVFITNHNDYKPPVVPDPVDLTVKKVWSDQNNKYGVRPSSVTVTLYNGNTAVEKVTLNASNNWTFSWTGLDGSGNWSVLETGIPSGYYPSYKTSNGVVTITNTYSPATKTGDESNVILYSSLLVVSVGTLVFLFLTGKKKKHKA